MKDSVNPSKRSAERLERTTLNKKNTLYTQKKKQKRDAPLNLEKESEEF